MAARRLPKPAAVEWVEGLDLVELEAEEKQLELELEVLRAVINAKYVSEQKPQRNGKKV